MYNRVKKFISKSIIIEREGEYSTPVSLTGVITFVVFVPVVGLCSKINIPTYMYLRIFRQILKVPN